MVQLLLFPPPATPVAPLPSKVRGEAKSLLASLLIAVTEGKKRESQDAHVHESGHRFHECGHC